MKPVPVPSKNDERATSGKLPICGNLDYLVSMTSKRNYQNIKSWRSADVESGQSKILESLKYYISYEVV